MGSQNYLHIFVFFLNFIINQILSKWRVTTDIDRVACTRICGQKNSEAATEMGQKSTMGVKHWNSGNTVAIEAAGEQIGSGHCLVGNWATTLQFVKLKVRQLCPRREADAIVAGLS